MWNQLWALAAFGLLDTSSDLPFLAQMSFGKGALQQVTVRRPDD